MLSGGFPAHKIPFQQSSNVSFVILGEQTEEEEEDFHVDSEFR